MNENERGPAQPKPSDTSGDYSRRKFLSLGIKAAATVLTAKPSLAVDKPTQVARPKTSETNKEFLTVRQGLCAILERHEQSGVGGVVAKYFGLAPGAYPPERWQPDFSKALASLWEEKAKRFPKKEKLIGDQGKKQATDYRDQYMRGAHRPMSITQMVDTCARVAQGNMQSIVWDGLCTKNQISSQQDRLYKLCERIGGKELTAYSMTELMPSDHGALNVDLYDLLLREAGAHFVIRIPALYDEYLSFGPFQFTQFALFSTEDEKRGASLINDFLPKEKRIPGSVTKLETLEQHAQAAHLLAIHTLVRLLQSIEDQHLFHVLDHTVGSIGITQYIATAHHAPQPAITAFLSWLRADAKGKHSIHFPSDNRGQSLAMYAKKTNHNLLALGQK